MRRGRSQVIGKIAENIMGRFLSPEKWTVNALRDDDYGKDYLAERIEDPNTGALSGQAIYIQLKGTAKTPKFARAKKDCYSYQLKKKHAAYYADKVEMPVFLVLSHNSLRRVCYLFVQPFLDDKQGWRQKKSVAIHLPIANDLADEVAFEKAFEEAKAWMRRKRPSSLKEAHDAAIERYKKLDPRFELRVTFDLHGNPIFNVVKGPPINVKMRGKETIENAYKGKRVPIKRGEVEVEGSPIFEQLNETGGGWLQIESRRICDCEMSLTDADGKTIATLRDIRGEFKGAPAELTYCGTLRRSPFSVESGPFNTVKTDAPKELKPGKVLYKRDKWDGQPITTLANFDNAYSFFTSLERAIRCISRFIEDGNTLFELPGEPPAGEDIGLIASQLEHLNKARQVCSKLGIAPLHSNETYEEEFFMDVDEAYGLMFVGEWRQPFNGGSMELNLKVRGFTEKMLEPGDFVMVQESTYSIAGHTFEVGKIHHHFNEMVFERLPCDDPEIVRVVATGTKNSMRTLRLDESSPYAPPKPLDADLDLTAP